MDFSRASLLGSCLSRDYAREFFKLLVNYQDISASEAASRLNLHIRTSQDFLDALHELDIVEKVEVYEKKRPYFRYSLKVKTIDMSIDLKSLTVEQKSGAERDGKLREKKESGARFTTSRKSDSISSVILWTGEGRKGKERRINLTRPQGDFLYHLPFPGGEPMSVSEITAKAAIDEVNLPEILDIVDLLIEEGVIEVLS